MQKGAQHGNKHMTCPRMSSKNTMDAIDPILLQQSLFPTSATLRPSAARYSTGKATSPTQPATAAVTSISCSGQALEVTGTRVPASGPTQTKQRPHVSSGEQLTAVPSCHALFANTPPTGAHNRCPTLLVCWLQLCCRSAWFSDPIFLSPKLSVATLKNICKQRGLKVLHHGGTFCAHCERG